MTLQRPRPIRPTRPQGGFVLAVVLVLMVSLTLLVLTQVRRATVGQVLTVNSSEFILAETAAQSVLRYCEAAVMRSVGQPDSVRVTTPGERTNNDPPAWRSADKWTASGVSFTNGGVTFPKVTAYSCLYEDATGDLVPSPMANDINAESIAVGGICDVQPGLNPRLCKYRITARVTLDGGRLLHLQSEIRFAI
jgi:hypothetical protein